MFNIFPSSKNVQKDNVCENIYFPERDFFKMFFGWKISKRWKNQKTEQKKKRKEKNTQKTKKSKDNWKQVKIFFLKKTLNENQKEIKDVFFQGENF